MINWADTTDDPLNFSVRRDIEQFVRSISSVDNDSLAGYFCRECQGHEVLHIGCYEHADKYMHASGWKHRDMTAIAQRMVGLDINEAGVQSMRSQGFEAVCVDATSEIYIDDRFDRVIVGDVIEHVGYAQGLLSFAARHLKPGGKIIVSTPNPFFVGHVAKAWLIRPMVANFEHVSWISESNMLELARRANLELKAILYPVGHASRRALLSLTKRFSYRVVGTALFTSIIYVLIAPEPRKMAEVVPDISTGC